MKVIKPIAILPTMLLSSTVAEPAAADPAEWSAGTAYALNQFARRLSLRRVYKRLVAGTSAAAPESDDVNWEDYSATLRWAMFDQSVGSQTSGASPLEVVISPGTVSNSLALIELVGSQVDITMRDGLGGPVVYTRSVALEVSSVTDWYGYFFEPYQQRSSVILTGLPPYPSGHITVTITGPSTVKCGGCILGTVYRLGDTEPGPTAGIRTSSRKLTDDGTYIVRLEKRKSSKTLRSRFRLPAGSVNAVHSLLTDLLDVPVVWIGDDNGAYDPLVVFGFYKDFSLDVAFPTVSFYSLEIEGMT